MPGLPYCHGLAPMSATTNGGTASKAPAAARCTADRRCSHLGQVLRISVPFVGPTGTRPVPRRRVLERRLRASGDHAGQRRSTAPGCTGWSDRSVGTSRCSTSVSGCRFAAEHVVADVGQADDADQERVEILLARRRWSGSIAVRSRRSCSRSGAASAYDVEHLRRDLEVVAQRRQARLDLARNASRSDEHLAELLAAPVQRRCDRAEGLVQLLGLDVDSTEASCSKTVLISTVTCCGIRLPGRRAGIPRDGSAGESNWTAWRRTPSAIAMSTARWRESRQSRRVHRQVDRRLTVGAILDRRDPAHLDAADLHLGIRIHHQAGATESTVTGTLSEKPPRNRLAATTNTTMASTMETKPTSGRRRLRVIARLRAGTRARAERRPAARSNKPVPPPPCIRCWGRTLRGNISLGQRFLCRDCDCLMFGDLAIRRRFHIVFAVQGSHTQHPTSSGNLRQHWVFCLAVDTALHNASARVGLRIQHQITEQKLGYASHDSATGESPSRSTPGSVPIPSTYPNNDGARGGFIWPI